jgi:hypothetical protein
LRVAGNIFENEDADRPVGGLSVKLIAFNRKYPLRTLYKCLDFLLQIERRLIGVGTGTLNVSSLCGCLKFNRVGCGVTRMQFGCSGDVLLIDVRMER